MALTIADVEHVAALARLGLEDDEKSRLRDQLSSILDHISVLQQVNTDAIPPTAQVIPLNNVMRADVAGASFTQAEALANAPHHADGFFQVLAVLGNDDETSSSS